MVCGIEDLERQSERYYQKPERSTPVQLMGALHLKSVYIEREKNDG